MTISVTDTAGTFDQSLDSDQDVVLSVKGISKKFCRDLKRSLLYGVQDIAGEVVGKSHANQDLRPKEFWALQDVSFELKRGEALGLVGKNGSGKSTLLRIIAGLIKPDKGTVEVNGRVAPLIALGAGFNPILTGRENIYANMSILGLSKQEIDDRFDDVIEFAEIGEAIDAPVQSYSSGMAARLGFASAIFTEPDILLVDEVLAVGDVQFRAKCARYLSTLQGNGSSIILVSHNSSAICSMCTTSVYLSKGSIILNGKTENIIRKYEEDLFLNSENIRNSGNPVRSGFYKERNTDSDVRIKYIEFKNKNNDVISSPCTGELLSICIGCEADYNIEDASLIITIFSSHHNNESILHLKSNLDNIFMPIKKGMNEMQLCLPCCGLMPGVYSMNVFVSRPPIHHFDGINAYRFKVKPSNKITLISQSLYFQPHSWNVDSDLQVCVNRGVDISG